MKTAHCKTCWQEVSARVSLCPRCGQTDGLRARKADARTMLAICGGVVAAALTLWSMVR